ncbi:MAG TPA: LUD domain-containing protein [Polyangia bacterium]|jgi:L-lactate dehydrogenase complex protein LldG|nr:LUD domain-containing protein [Polyangia bacterium]
MDERAFIERFRREGVLRRHPGAYPPPSYEATWQRFGRMLSAVGGTFVGPVDRAAMVAATSEAIARAGGRCVASVSAAPLLDGIGGWSVAHDGGSRPHALADVELGILTAECAVAENAAVLLSARSLPERALAFLAQHLLVLIPVGSLIADLVTAQAGLSVPLPHHLTWMSGPSKTADIEQTLVIGAHGSRSLTVIAY